MSEEKKPKIDLKARLGKTQTGLTGTVPAPVIQNAPGSIPPPTGVPTLPSIAPGPIGHAPQVSSPAPSSPFASSIDAIAGVSPFAQASAPPAAPQQTQIIEIDETSVQNASKAAFKKAMGFGAILAVVFAGVGFVAGSASKEGSMQSKAMGDAQLYKENIEKSKTQLEALEKKLSAGRDALRSGKFPDTLASELNSTNIDFDGSQLIGRRYNGKAMIDVIAYITSVQALNDKKSLVAKLLTKLQKPLTEQFQTAGKAKITHVVAITKDASGPSAYLAPLTEALVIDPQKIELPSDFTFMVDGKNQKAKRYTSGSVDNAALPVLSKSISASFPSDTSQAGAQLMAQVVSMIIEIKGEGGDAMEGGKAGLIDKATRISKALEAKP